MVETAKWEKCLDVQMKHAEFKALDPAAMT